MRTITLREYRSDTVTCISRDEALSLADLVRDLRVEPSRDDPGAFVLTPGSTIGALWLPDLEVQILPKIPMSMVLFLVSYAVDPRSWREQVQRFQDADTVVEAVAPAFLHFTKAATGRGLLHGYRTEEDSLLTVRGQIRFGDQIGRRFGRAPPVEVRYDEFSADILENRLLKAALRALSRLRLRSTNVASALHERWAAFEPVSTVVYDPRAIPEPVWTRLNQHYKSAVTLARLILRGCSIDLGAGSFSGTGFLIDMNNLFESFLHRALLEALGVPDSVLRRGSPSLNLDAEARVRLKPDLSWWRFGRCAFVGDAKYKRPSQDEFVHADLYQILAYAAAAQLRHALVIYADMAGGSAVHRVHLPGSAVVDLEVAGLDLSADPTSILRRIGRIAEGVRRRALAAAEG